MRKNIQIWLMHKISLRLGSVTSMQKLTCVLLLMKTTCHLVHLLQPLPDQTSQHHMYHQCLQLVILWQRSKYLVLETMPNHVLETMPKDKVAIRWNMKCQWNGMEQPVLRKAIDPLQPASLAAGDRVSVMFLGQWVVQHICGNTVDKDYKAQTWW